MRFRVLAILSVLSIITYLDRVCISVAGPRIQQDLGLTPQIWGWVLGVFTLGYSFFEIPSGALGDRIGPRQTLTRIVLWWSAFTALTGTVSRAATLLVTRFLFGAGEAGAYPNITTSISRWFPPAERARAQGIIWMASRVGGALSPLLVVAIQRSYGWRASFWCFGISGVIWAAAWYAYARDWPSEVPHISSVELAEIGDAGRQRPHAAVDWPTALRSKNLWTIALMFHAYCWASHFYISWLPTYLQKGRGFSEQQMGLFGSLPFVAGMVANLFGGFLSDRLARKKGLRFGRCAIGFTCLLSASGLVLVAALTPNRIVAVTTLALGYGCLDTMLPSAWAVCLDVGKHNAGAVSACMNMSGQLGSFLSSVTYGYVIGATHNYSLPLFVMSGMLVISALLFSQIHPEQTLAMQVQKSTLAPI